MPVKAPVAKKATTTPKTPAGDVKDFSLAAKGKARIEWADTQMPVLRAIRARFEKEQPLKGHRIAACLHVTTETSNLMRTLKAGGAEVNIYASNPLSTQDDNAASLAADYGIATYAIRGEDSKTYYKHIHQSLDLKPTMTLDEGADLVTALHKELTELLKGITASMEETTTGVIRLRAMHADGALKIPVVAVNDATTKHLFDNRYGTGQSTMDGIVRATNRGPVRRRRAALPAGVGNLGEGAGARAPGRGPEPQQPRDALPDAGSVRGR
jgi:adenosylhomocysteinase